MAPFRVVDMKLTSITRHNEMTWGAFRLQFPSAPLRLHRARFFPDLSSIKRVVRRVHIPRFKFAVAASLVILSSAANANYTCSGPVKGVSLEVTTGDILVESIGNVSWPRLCNINYVGNGIPPAVCKNVHAMLLTAQTLGKSVTLWSNDPRTACPSDLTPWHWVPGFYFLRLND